MIVKAIYKDKKFNYFRDVETNDKRVYGDIFECDDALAEERIEKGLVKKASKKEEKEYIDQLETMDEGDAVPPEIESTNTEEEKENEEKDLTPDSDNDIVPPEGKDTEDSNKDEQ